MSLRIVRPRRRVGRLKIGTRIKARWQAMTERARRRLKSIVAIFAILSFAVTLIRLWMEWRK